MFAIKDIDLLTKLVKRVGIGPVLKLLADIVMMLPDGTTKPPKKRVLVKQQPKRLRYVEDH